jgi:hypothetical protein
MLSTQMNSTRPVRLGYVSLFKTIRPGKINPKAVNRVSEGGRVGKKEGTDAERLRPKADQAVSSVSAAPALVDEYCPPLNQRETED